MLLHSGVAWGIWHARRVVSRLDVMLDPRHDVPFAGAEHDVAVRAD